MNNVTRLRIKTLIKGMIEKKLATYSPESENMPFFRAIFSKEQILTASIIQSFYTSFGMSVYEQIAVELAKGAGYAAVRQYELLGTVDSRTESKITKLHQKLREGESWDAESPREAIASSIRPGKAVKDPDSVVDLFLKRGSEEYYFGITTVKPNKEGFNTHTKKLMRWIALRLSTKKEASVNVGVVIPYNPYEPNPYNRWDCQRMFGTQLYVGEQFWDFVGRDGAYKELLKIFEEVGNETREAVKHMASAKKSKRSK